MKAALLALSILLSFATHSQVAINDGDWATDGTWQSGTSPGFTNLPNVVIDAYVISNSGISFSNTNTRILTISDTLIVYGDVIFSSTKNNATINVGANNLLVIYGNLELGKNTAGVDVAAGGVVVVTGTISASGVEANSTIQGAGKVYSNNPTGLTANNSEAVQTIGELSGDGYTTVEDFVTGGGTITLPVELLHFNAFVADQVTLHWATATEINNDYFAIERSEDGTNFYEIGRVNGSGSTNQQIDYTFIDKFPFSSTEYYRLKQVDYDGDFEHFEVLRIDTQRESAHVTLHVFPTIVENGNLTIKSNQPFQMQELTIYNLNGGKSVSLTNQSKQENPLTYQVNTQFLTTGLYLLEVTTSLGETSSYKLKIN